MQMEEIRKADNNIMDFYESEGYIRFEKNTMATTRQLYIAYCQWCQDNLERPLAEKTFTQQLKKDAEALGLTYDGERRAATHNMLVERENLRN